MERYIRRKDKAHVRVLDKYIIQGFISSGTYGKVYKACNKRDLNDTREYAIKKFKAEKEGESATYSGLSQSACREMSLCRELRHDNVVLLQEIILEDKCIYMIFEFYEYDLLQIIHYHLHQSKAKQKIPDSVVRGILQQLLQGVAYLHENWVLHRDLKPANIMITKSGIVKIGDLGLARPFHNPLQPLYTGDKVVVTIWYRAPELLLGSKHYGPAIDLWAVGCIFAELLVLRPLFKGDEVKVDAAPGGAAGGGPNHGNKKQQVPFQRQQMLKIVEILGTPSAARWPGVVEMPDYHQLRTFRAVQFNNQLPTWYRLIGAMASTHQGLKLLMNLLEYDPGVRLTAQEALQHAYFAEGPRAPSSVGGPAGAVAAMSVFGIGHGGQQQQGGGFVYPDRQIKVEDSDMSRSSNGKAAAAAVAAAPTNINTNSNTNTNTTGPAAAMTMASRTGSSQPATAANGHNGGAPATQQQQQQQDVKAVSGGVRSGTVGKRSMDVIATTQGNAKRAR